MTIGVCPCTGDQCVRSECYTDGCQFSATVVSVLMACEDCGELHVAFFEPPLCIACWLKAEAGIADGG